MSSSDSPKKPLADLVEVAQKIIEGKEPIVSGLRKITHLADKTPYPKDKSFLSISGYESETDGYPLGQVRDNYAADFLRRLDADMDKYLAGVRNDIINTCKEIVHKYKNRTDPRLCPVCGYSGLGDPPYDKFGCPSYQICPCCDVEYGYEDAGRSHAELRKEWIDAGTPWRGKIDNPPPNWNAREQLLAAGFGPP